MAGHWLHRFSRPLEAGRTLRWRAASPLEGDELLITDGASKVYLLEVQRGGAPAVVTVAEAGIRDAVPATGFVGVGDAAVAVSEAGQLIVLQIPSLEQGQSLNPGGRVIWGPHRAGDYIVLATSSNLMAVDGKGQFAWQVPLDVAKFTGPPLVSGDSMVAASESGAIVKVQLNDGSELARVDAGEPLAAGPVLLNNRLVVAGRDGALLVVESP